MTSSRGLARRSIKQEEFSRPAKSKEVVITLEWLGLGNDMCPREIRSRKSSFEVSKISLLGIQLGSWGFWLVPWLVS